MSALRLAVSCDNDDDDDDDDNNDHVRHRQLSSLHLAVSAGSCSQIRQLASSGLDLGLPLRGQTALYLSVIHGRSEVTRELLREMMKARSVARNINIFSVDHVSRSASS